MKNIQFVSIILIAFLILAAVQQTKAATFTVINTNDSGAGSLRQAILDANVNNEDDAIVFDSGVFNTPQTITLTSGQLVIDKDAASGSKKKLILQGPGANLLTISGNKQSLVLLVQTNASAVISGIKITEGNTGINVNLADNFTLINSIVSGNGGTAQYGGGLSLFSGIILYKIINSTISNNHAETFGGGINLYNGKLEIINSTVSDNQAAKGGAGIYVYGTSLYLTNSTVAFNQVTQAQYESNGAGIYLDESGSTSSRLYSRNSIVSNNNTNILDPNSYEIRGSIISSGNNIFGSVNVNNISGGATGANADQLNVNPQLDPSLSVSGNGILFHAFAASSSAIDKGNDCVFKLMADGGCVDLVITTDQRGVSRPQDGDGDGIATVDIGSFEATREEVASAPSTAPDLQPESDSGISDTDNITSASTLSFIVSGVTAGDTIELLRNGIVAARAVAAGNTIVLTDNQATETGAVLYSARQTNGNTISLQGPLLLVNVDRTSPTVTVNQAANQLDPTHNPTINFTVVFSEPVTGFNASNVSLAASTAGVSSAIVVVTGSGTTYNVAVGNLTADGIVRPEISAGSVRDIAGNPNVASTGTDNAVTYDTTRPTVTVNQAANQSDPTRNQTVNFTVVFSEIVNGFSRSGISLAGSTANVSSAVITITGTGTTYNVAVGNVISNGGTVRLSLYESAAIDLASNPSVVSTSTDNEVTVDNVAPTVTINQAAGQADPTNQLPINFTVIFSEPVTGFDPSDIFFSGSSINTSGATVSITGSGTTYNVAVGNITSNGGVVRASVKSSAAADLAGNSNIASTSTDNAVTIDNIAPSASINQAIGQSDPALNQPINFTVVFSELVSDFDASDVSLDGSTANVSAAVISVTGSGNVYSVKVSKITSGGQVRAGIPGGAARDAAGNLSSASTSSDNTVIVIIKNAFFDFDGDGKSDISVFRPESSVWYLLQSRAGFTGAQFGISTDKIVPADYDGDGKTDLAVYRGGTWYIQRSSAGFTGVAFGAPDDIPQPADFDGDGKAELAVYRPSNGGWYVFNLATNQFTSAQFGAPTDKPVIGDYNGDGRADYAVFRPLNGTWYIARPGGVPAQNFDSIQFGSADDKPVQADFDGDGKTDVAVFRPSSGTWYRLNSSNGQFIGTQFGISTDLPAPADYDGDGKADVAVYRDGTWYLNRSTQGFLGIQFGAATDKPIPNSFLP